MMDEIELQLCLNIDTAVSCNAPSPSRPPSKDTCESKPSDEKQKQKQKHVHRAPQLHVLRSPGKRPSGSFGGEGDGREHEGDGAGGDGDGENCDSGRGQHLRLPPRKRARTSLLSLEPKDGTGSGGDNDIDVAVAAAAAAAATNIDPMGNLEREPSGVLREIGSVLEGVHGLSPLENDIRTQNVDAEAGMDIDGDSDAETEVNAVDLTSQPEDTVFHRPQLPFVHHPEGAYMPAIPDSLSSPRGEQLRHAHCFSIYEDPEDMDIDGVGFFEMNWYLSPEDDKENIAVEVSHQNQHPHRHEHEYEHGHSNEHDQNQDHDYHRLFAEEPYNPRLAIEQQRAYHSIRTIFHHLQDPIISTGGTGSPQEGPNSRIPLPEASRQFPDTEPGIGRDHDHQLTEHTLLYPSLHNAAEVSLRVSSQPDAGK
ncbi:hypothetical protein BJX76DRAFT_327938 [Aspergillus varians]